ncbi:hypothetical protein [Saccharothrix sp. ALI-22-I]|uniref:hypothetical protein n=1 Tax=Saccharothrix sp. ALI-22-I TaxID=1933778 RepID=UPI00117B956B|nr:hypothetical protein [Saccharothrix sp. ALI-22-I]
MADDSPGPQSGLSSKVLGVLAIVADMAAVVAWIGSPGPLFAAVAGSLLLLTGLLLFLQMARNLPKFRVAAALGLIVAGSITITVVVDHSLTGAVVEATGRSPSSQVGLKTGSETVDSDVSSQARDPRASPTGATVVSSPTGPVEGVPLSSIPIAPNSQRNFEGGSLRVGAVDHDNVLLMGKSTSCVFGPVILQADRRYASLKMSVGVSDDYDPAIATEFQVKADGVVKGGVTVRVGKVEPVEVDVSGALRIELEADSNQCDTQLGLIDAVAVPAL